MARRSSPTDRTDDEWRRREPRRPPAKPGGRPRRVARRAVVNAVRSPLRAGCAWRLVPHEVPPWPTVSASVRRWEADGPGAAGAGALRRDRRAARGRDPEPSAAILDSQPGTTTEQGGRAASPPGRTPPAASATSWSPPTAS